MVLQNVLKLHFMEIIKFNFSFNTYYEVRIIGVKIKKDTNTDNWY